MEVTQEKWTEITVTVDTKDIETAGNIANMVVPYGIYIEDYSALEEETMEIAHIDLIEVSLLQKDRTKGIIHIYISPEENPAEAVSFLEERLQSAGIAYTLGTDLCAMEDWVNNWKKYFHPMPVGDKLLIRPTWEEAPDTGWVQRGPSVRTAYLPQIVRFAVPERSMLDTMLYECKCTPQEARDQLGAYGFCGEDVLKPVSALSGGELSRLRLCMLMRREINFLILDEPTNHLDIASREWIEDALSDYTQALLFVSHDRYFIEKFATRIWLLENGTITDYRGTYEEFRAYRARQTALQQTAKAVERKKEPKPKPKRAPNTTRARERTEREIEKLEGQLAALDAESEANATDYQKLMEIDARKQALNAQLEALYEAWEALCE